MSAKHTPGPWIAIRSIPVEGYDGWYLKAQPNHTMRGFTQEIGWVNGGDENTANARLIAAAPEMLEALKHARDQIQHPDQMIDEAITKAEGRS